MMLKSIRNPGCLALELILGCRASARQRTGKVLQILTPGLAKLGDSRIFILRVYAHIRAGV